MNLLVELLRTFWTGTFNVCARCRADSDEVVGPAGDYSLCSLCREPITSKTGWAVRPKRRTP